MLAWRIRRQADGDSGPTAVSKIRMRNAKYFRGGYGRVCGFFCFGGYLFFLGFHLGPFLFCFLTKIYTITDFGDDGGVADGGTKSVIIVVVASVSVSSVSLSLV